MFKIRHKLPQQTENINIMPLMNIIMLLIPFLIMSTEFMKLGVINSTMPKTECSDCEQKVPKTTPEKKPLRLTITISQKGFTLLTRRNKIPGGCDLKNLDKPHPSVTATLPRLQGKLNFVGLRSCLEKLKKLFPKERNVIIAAEAETYYNAIVKTMDISRTTTAGKELFPLPIIGAGIR